MYRHDVRILQCWTIPTKRNQSFEEITSFTGRFGPINQECGVSTFSFGEGGLLMGREQFRIQNRTNVVEHNSGEVDESQLCCIPPTKIVRELNCEYRQLRSD